MRFNSNSNRNLNNSGNGTAAASMRPTSWIGWKERGKSAYERGDYEEALDCYKTALQTEYECHAATDRQVLLSNVVACRLKIGGSAQAAAAVENAKQCVDLNPSWSKGHVRLASAYIALGADRNRSSGHHSNDACNALQTALRLDPGNQVARDLLIRELRRDHASASSSSSTTTASAPSSDFDVDGVDSPSSSSSRQRDPPYNPHYTASQQQQSGDATAANNNNNVNAAAADTATAVDDGLTWQERLAYHRVRIMHWYSSQSDFVQTAIKVGLVLLVLYIGFGGRFGLENRQAQRYQRSSIFSSRRPQPTEPAAASDGSTTRGNYGSGNAYEEYRRRRSQGTLYDDDDGQVGSGGYDYYSHFKRQKESSQNRRHGNTYSSSSSWHFPNLLDGSMSSMAILLGVAYMCHRNGINPFQVLMILNMVGGRRRGGRHHGGGMYYGGGGMRYGMGRRGGRGRYW